MGKFIDLTGVRFTRLLVLKRDFKGQTNKNVKWLCICDCGEKKSCQAIHLRRESIKSCGCLQREQNDANRYTHGLSKTPEYNIWTNIKSRCGNPKNNSYKDYGGRGIYLCQRWLNFEHFYNDMGSRPSKIHSIDRIDNNLGYSPDNCKWSTPIEQANNKTSSKIIKYKRISQSLADWSRDTGLNYDMLKYRINAGWPVERALNEPSKKINRVYKAT